MKGPPQALFLGGWVRRFRGVANFKNFYIFLTLNKKFRDQKIVVEDHIHKIHPVVGEEN